MSTKKKIGIILVGAYILYLLNTLFSTGYFREIENSSNTKILKSIAIPGAEDMQISYEDNFMLLSSDDRTSRRDGRTKQGHLYYINLKDTAITPIQLTGQLDIPFFPHGISMIKIDSLTYKVYVVNHVNDEHSIEVFHLIKDSLRHITSLKDESMISPNDIVAIDEERFYFTNDHQYTEGIMYLGEEYLGWAVSNVIYYDGNSYKEVADGIAYANGINYDKNRELIFVASPRGFLVKVFQREKDGSLNFVENIDCGTGVDNIELDESGKIWIGSHPNLFAFTLYAAGKNPIAPSEIITIDYRSKGDFSKETFFLDHGNNMSASTVAVVYGNYVFTGNPMDDHFLVLKKE